MSNQKLRAIYKQLNDKIEDAKEAALFEVKELKDDLNELQRHYSGRKKETDIQPDDILRSAYEIAHRMREIQKRREILAEMEDTAAETEALAYLDSRGAKFLTRPVGWHFQTSSERFLLHAEDAVLAAAELRKLLAAGKRLKKPAKRKPVAKKPEAKKSVEKKAVEKTAEKAASAKGAAAKKPVKAKKAEKPAKAAKVEKKKTETAKAPAKTKVAAKTDKVEKTAKPRKAAKTEKGKTAAKPKAEAEVKPKKASKPKKAEKSKADPTPVKKPKSAKKVKAESDGKTKKAAKPKSKKK